MKKFLTFTLSFVMTISLLATTSHAQTTNLTKDNFKNSNPSNVTLKLDPSDKLDNILMNLKSYKEMISKEPDAKLVLKKPLYYKIEKNQGAIQKTAYTPSEYQTEFLNESISSVTSKTNKPKSYGWIDVQIYGYTLPNGNSTIFFVYDWKTIPYYQLTDAIVIGADNDLKLISSTVYAWHYIKYQSGAKRKYTFNWDSPTMKSLGANTYGTNVPLVDQQTRSSVVNCNGGISIDGVKNNNVSFAKIWGSYGHRQISLSPNASFSFSTTSFSFGFALTKSYDEAPCSSLMEFN